MKSGNKQSRQDRIFALTLLLVGLIGSAPGAAQESASGTGASFYYSPENVLRFGDFLMSQGDYLRAAAEYQRYLFSNANAENPRLLYRMGLCHFKAAQAEQATLYFRQAASNAQEETLQDSARVAFATMLLVAKREREFSRCADSLRHSTSAAPVREKLFALESLYFLRQQNWQRANELLSSAGKAAASPEENLFAALQHLAQRGAQLPKKSGALAAALSTVIPGSGRIYAGRSWDGIYSFILTAGTGWLAYEGFRDEGAASAKGRVFGGLAAFFYLGDIYGSVLAVRLHNQHVQNKLAHDVELQLQLLAHF